MKAIVTTNWAAPAVVLACVLAIMLVQAGPVYGDSHTVADVQRSLGKTARDRMLPYFADAKTEYPPRQIALLAVTQAATLELWAGPDTNPKFLRHYSMKRRGDDSDEAAATVEGVYEVKRLHPNTESGVAIELIYTGDTDREQPASIYLHASNDNTEQPNGGIGVDANAIEELFILAADVGKRSIKVLIAADDPRLQPDSASADNVVGEAFLNYLRTQP